MSPRVFQMIVLAGLCPRERKFSRVRRRLSWPAGESPFRQQSRSTVLST